MPKNKKNLTETRQFSDNFAKRIGNIPANIVSKIAKIDELKGQWISGAQLSPQVLGRLKRSVLITSTGASTRIEGARLTDADIEKMMRGINIQKFTNRDQQEAKGYYELLTNLLLLHAGYLYIPYISHEKLIEDNKPDYYIALRRSQKNIGSKKENITAWLNFFLGVVLKQSQMAVKLLSKENIEKILSEKQLIIWQYIEKTKKTSTRDIIKNTNIVRPTVKQALEALLKLKKIERIGLGRSARYRIV